MRYQEAYANVPVGLEEAQKKLIDAYQSPLSQYIIEALIIDPETPIGVYTDLLGWDSEDLEEYKKYFFNVDANMPRLQLYEFIRSAPELTDGDKMRKELLINVFEFGWSYIDSKYNRSNRIKLNDEIETGVKKMFGGINTLIDQQLRKPSAQGMRALLAFMKDGVSVIDATKIEQEPTETMTFDFVDKIQNEVKEKVGDPSKIMSIEFDPLMRLKPPEGEEKKELEQILKDTKS